MMKVMEGYVERKRLRKESEGISKPISFIYTTRAFTTTATPTPST
jgi:hypothetical protein